MIIGNKNRLNYRLNHLVETGSHLIIDGYPYDKKSMAKISNEPVETGMLKDTGYEIKALGANVSFACSDAFKADNSVLARITDRGYSTGVCSVQDSDNMNLEYTFFGDSIIIYNSETKTFETILIGSSINNQQTVYLTQDSKYVYYLASNYSYIYDVQIMSFDKTKKTVKSLSSVYQTSDMIKVTVLNRDTTNVQLALSGYLKTNFCYLEFNTNENTVTITGMNPDTPSTAVSTGYGTQMPSRVDKYGWVYYNISYSTSSEIGCHRITNQTAVPDSKQSALLSNEDKIKMNNFITTRYNITDDSDGAKVSAKRNELMNYDSYSLVRSHFFLGDNDEFLIQTHFSDLKAYTPSGAQQYIAVYKRNNPETDPLDLTLVDYLNATEIGIDSTQKIKNIQRITETRFILPFDQGLYYIDFNKSTGLITKTRFNYPNIVSVGFDEFNRMYLTNSVNTDLEVISEKVVYNLDLNYENTSDKQFYIEDNPITKKIRVKTTNINGQPVQGTFKLTILGSGAEFSSQSTEFRGQTSKETGESLVSFTVKKQTKLNIIGEILYNNELSEIETASSRIV